MDIKFIKREKNSSNTKFLPYGNSNLASIRMLCPVDPRVPTISPFFIINSPSKENHLP